jgi:hypothetical protein
MFEIFRGKKNSRIVDPIPVPGKTPEYVSKVLTLYKVNGLNSKEIADRTGSTTSDVTYVLSTYKQYCKENGL